MKKFTAPPDERWYEFIGQIDWLLIDTTYLSAWASLRGIRDTVMATQRVNDAQRYVVDRIRASALN